MRGCTLTLHLEALAQYTEMQSQPRSDIDRKL